ncbi:MAG: hypothetical protein WAU86_19975, partial [Oricola sp.]
LPMNGPINFQSVDGHRVLNAKQILRLYLDRPWHVTGEGEMLGIVFDKSWREQNNRSVKELKDRSTAWGEDPIYRTYESEVVDNLSPEIVARMFDMYVAGAQFDDGYPTWFQAELSTDSFNIVVDGDRTGDQKIVQDYRAAHIVCVRPTYDPRARLWYVELDPGDRNRWFRLKLCRFQKHSLEGFHFSREPVSVSFFSTRSDTVTVNRRINVSEITLDTVPYSGALLQDKTPYNEMRYSLYEAERLVGGVFNGNSVRVAVELSTKKERGNLRHVWKLPRGDKGVYVIFDHFRERSIAEIDLEALQ